MENGYDIVSARTTTDLVAEVHRKLNRGWERAGGPFYGKDGFHQAAVKTANRIAEVHREPPLRRRTDREVRSYLEGMRAVLKRYDESGTEGLDAMRAVADLTEETIEPKEKS